MLEILFELRPHVARADDVVGLNRRPARRRLALPEKCRQETHHERRAPF